MKKGISLIVLIVTIIVIIILAAAVILTLNKNNPIDSSRVSQLADNRASMNSAIQLYFGKVMAETQGIFENKDIFLGGNADLNGAHKYIPRIVDSASASGATNFHKLTTKSGTNKENNDGLAASATETDLTKKNGVLSTESALDLSIPSISGATWYVDVRSGLVYLVYSNYADMPNWMFTVEVKANSDKTAANLDTTLATFVKATADLATI